MCVSDSDAVSRGGFSVADVGGSRERVVSVGQTGDEKVCVFRTLIGESAMMSRTMSQTS